MLKTKYILIASMALMAITGCKKDYLDINKNPNQATGADITPDLTITAQMTSTASRVSTGYAFLHRWMGYWSASGSYALGTVEMSYNIDNGFGAGLFEGAYYTAGQYKSIETKAHDLGWTYYEGISKILGALEILNVVDVYNNVPYSKAFDLSGNIRPAYDKGEDVYKGLFAQVDAGIALIKAADKNKNPNIATRDLMFGGDATKWAKFGNTLKLKMLLHASKTATFSAATEVAKMTDGFLGAGVSANVQPGYTADKPNPYFSSYMFNAITGAENDNYNRANNFALGLMQGLNDPRDKYIYRLPASPTGGTTLRGTDYGAAPLTANSSANTSGVGYGIGKSFTMPQFVLTSVEASFLVAEATARGWIAGDAQAAYTAAVTESFNYLGVANAATAVALYMSSPSPKVAWPTSGVLADKIAVIAWQKYFALNGINALETWCDVRRLQVVAPALSVANERGSNPLPRRLLYPTSEYSYNTTNVSAQGTISQFTSKVFWDN